MFDDYGYVPGQESLPQPGTTNGPQDWGEFVTQVVHGIENVVQTKNGVVYQGSGTGREQTAPGTSDKVLPLLIIGLLLLVVIS